MKRFTSDTANTQRLQFPFNNTITSSDHLESGDDQSEILLSYPEFKYPLELDQRHPKTQDFFLSYAKDGIIPSNPEDIVKIALYCMQHGEHKALLYLLSADHGQVEVLDFSGFDNLHVKHIQLLNDVLKKLGSNTKLHDLILRKCVENSSQETIQAVAELIKNACTLKSLDLQNNGIQAPGIEIICQALQNNYSLTSINLSSNRITVNPHKTINYDGIVCRPSRRDRDDSHDDTGAKAIATVLENNHTLTSIDLSSNHLYSDSACVLAEALTNSALVSLDLNRNDINELGAKAIATALEKNNTLTSLNLSFCSIAETGGQSVIHALANNHALTFIDLSQNNLNIESATAIGSMLSQNHTLTSLKLDSNWIRDAGAKAIAGGLENNKTLHTLALNWSEIGNDGARSIAGLLTQNNSLTTIDLSHNNIGYLGTQALVYAMGKNHTLSALDLRRNVDKKFNSLDMENKKAINEYLGPLLFSKNADITITHPDGREETVERKALPKEVTNIILSKLPSIDMRHAMHAMVGAAERKSIMQRIQL
jgi:Ran GTPase-activating protein (RanGAP) involved in mRNA processing and transport